MVVNTDQVQLRSYLIWEREGRPQGRDWDFWFLAESELAEEEAAGETPEIEPAANVKASEPAKSSAKKKAANEAA